LDPPETTIQRRERTLIVDLLVLPVSYLLGSIPWGLIVGKLKAGIDVRGHGSGSTGMTNVLRTMGVRFAVFVLLMDTSKGILAVLLVRFLDGSPLAESLAATLAVLGHNWPIYSGFRGGRGIATGVGGLTMLFPMSGVIAVSVFIIPVLVTRYVSLGSVLAVISAMITIPVFTILDIVPWQYIFYVYIAGPAIIWKHRGNIQRLANGTERRLGQQEEMPAQAQ